MRLLGFRLLALAALSVPLGNAAEYYVSTSGSDAAPGTFGQPFRTIQKAAAVMVAGDVAYIRSGIYRETVVPAHSGRAGAPILFTSYNGEPVTVSGADAIDPASWSPYKDNIYQAPLALDLGGDANQVFVDGSMMIEARWPNTTLDISHPLTATVSGGSFLDGGSGLSTGTIADPNLPPRPEGYWTGATINGCFGVCYLWQPGKVTDSSDGRLTFTFRKIWDLQTPGSGRISTYYLSGKLGELDAPGEWFADGAARELYLWTPAGDAPARHTVEAKRRQWAFDLSARSFITVENIRLFAAGVLSDPDSSFLVLDRLDATYISHISRFSDPDPNHNGIESTGIVLNGENNVLSNSTLQYSGANGILIVGDGHRVWNNTISDADYLGLNNPSPIVLGTDPSHGAIVAWNTIANAAREGIRIDVYGVSTVTDARILHNDIHDYGLQTSDLGCIYSYGSNGHRTEIAYNVCHDGRGLLLDHSYPWTAGIYLDDGTSNFVVHHNLTWNVPWGMNLGKPATGHDVYNNTLAGTVFSLANAVNTPGTVVENNIFAAPIQSSSLNAVMAANILPGTDPKFVDPASHNYQLLPDSPAIGAGMTIPPYTDGFSGAAPDIGAYDHSRPPWKAGVQAAAYTYSVASQPSRRRLSPGQPLNRGRLLAPGETAVAFGTAPFDPGSTVIVTDGAGADVPATILSAVASPPEIRFVIPQTVAPGVAMITITNPDGAVSVSSALIFPRKRPRVLFDETHGEVDSIDYTRAAQLDAQHPSWRYLGRAVAAMQLGYDTSRLSAGSLTAQTLQNTDVLVMAAPFSSLSAAETEAVAGFVDRGGALLFLGSWGTPSSINSLLGRWGLAFDPSMLLSPPGNTSFNVTSFTTHPALPPAPAFAANPGGSFAVSQGAVALAQTSDKEWKSLSGKPTQQANDPNGPFVVMAAAQPGKGRVFAVADNNFVDVAPRTNLAIFLSALSWLSAAPN